MNIKKLLCLLMTVILVAVLLPSCGNKDEKEPEMIETLAEPDDKWYEVTEGEGVPEMESTKLKELIQGVLGDDVKWDGDFSKLTETQQNLIEEAMKSKGYSVAVTAKGITYFSYTPIPEPDELETIVREALGEDFEWDGKMSSLTEDEIDDVASKLKADGYNVAISNGSLVFSQDEKVHDKLYYEKPDEGEVLAVIYDKIGKEEFDNWDGNLSSLGDEVVEEVIKEFNDYGYNVKVSDDDKSIVNVEEPPETTTSVVEPTTSNDNGNSGSDETETVTYKNKTSLVSLNTYGGTGGDRIMDVEMTSDGGYVALANANSTNGYFSDAAKSGWNKIKTAFLKFDKDGNLLWKQLIGGKDGVEFHALTELTDGSIVGVGYTTSTSISNLDGKLTCPLGGGIDALIIKYSSGGTLQWVKSVKGSDGDMFVSVAATPDGDFVVGGKTFSSDGDYEGLTPGAISAVLTRYSGDGETIQWRKAFAGSMHNQFDDIAITPNGYVYAVCETMSKDLYFGEVAGYGTGTTSDSVVMKLTVNGNEVWHKTLYGSSSESFKGITVAPDGGCVVGGAFSENTLVEGTFNDYHNYGGFDAALLKLSAGSLEGGTEIKWILPLNGLKSDIILGVTTVDDGYVAIGQSASSNMSFANTPNKGQLDAFIAYASNDGKLISLETLAGSGNDTGLAIDSYDGKRFVAVGASSSPDGSFADGLSTKNTLGYVAVYDIAPNK